LLVPVLFSCAPKKSEVRKPKVYKKQNSAEWARVALRAAPKSLPKKLQNRLNHPFVFTYREMRSILQTIFYREINRMDILGNSKPVFSRRAVNRLAGDLPEAFLKAKGSTVVYFFLQEKDSRTAGLVCIAGGTMYWNFSWINDLSYEYKVKLKDTYGGEGIEPPNWRLSEKKGQQLYRVPGFISKYKKGNFLMLDLKHYHASGLKALSRGPSGDISGKAKGKKAEEKDEESVLERYRALKKLRTENIITESDYNRKAKELMKGKRSLTVSEELKLLNYFWMDGLVKENEYERKKKKLLERL
jgi:hypothetical protein